MALLVRSASLFGVVEAAQSVGVDPYPILAACGFTPASLANPDLRIAAEPYGRLLESIAVAAGCDDFGLRLAETRELFILGPLGLLLREQNTFGDVLTAVRRYASLHTEAVDIKMETADGLAVATVEISRIAGMSPLGVRLSLELSIGTIYRTLRTLLAHRWHPISICFRHDPPASLALHRRFFGCPVEFRHDFSGLVFHEDDLAMAIPRADPRMERYVRNYLESLLQNAPTTAVDQVRELAKALLPSGLCTVERIAKHMHVDYRTIQRRLEREGTSFTEILNGIRTEMSQHYLEPNNRSLSDIAYSLGFSSLSAFSRWFQTQYGCSPTKWRKGKFARM